MSFDRWVAFFSEEEQMGVDRNGRKEETEETEEIEEITYKQIFHFLQNFHFFHSSSTLPAFLEEYLSSRGSQPKRALAEYLLRGPMTDHDLTNNIGYDASVIRNKDSVKGLTEPQGEEKPLKYCLTASAKVIQEQELREWLQNRLDALERDKRLRIERERASVLNGAVRSSGRLRPDLISQFGKGNFSVNIGFADLARFDPVLGQELLDNPVDTLQLGVAALKGFDGGPRKEDRVKLLISDLPSSSHVSLRDVRTAHTGRLLELVVEPESVSEVRPICLSARFECPSCGAVIPVIQRDERFIQPSVCACGRKGRFHLLDKERDDFAVVGVTQPIGEVLSAQGRRAQMKMYVDGSLTVPDRMSKVTPGQPLRVVAYPIEEPVLLKGGGQSRRFDLALQTVSYSPVEDYSFSLSFKEEEIVSFRSAARDPKFLESFAESCFPSHHGDNHIKQALSLQLLRGRFDRRVEEEGLNILLSGDPGTGKTRNFLRRSVSLAPIGRFVQATNSSQAGLLGSSSTKDQDSGRFTYEPGALPRTHRGIIAIDEIASLIPEEMKALNEALEEGIITIDKATLHVKVPADIAALAAGNPKNGRFDLGYSGVSAEVLGIEASTLDRFDLIYILLDIPEKEKDRFVADKINSLGGSSQKFSDEWLRRYVLYSRYGVHPSLRSVDALQLRDFYVNMRQLSTEGTLTISARQYRTLRALTLLSAKAHLRTETCEQDVKIAVSLVEPMLQAFGFDMSSLRKYSGG